MTKKKYKKLKKKFVLLSQENHKLRLNNIFLKASDVWRPALSAMYDYRNLNSVKPVDRLVASEQVEQVTVSPITIWNLKHEKTHDTYKVVVEFKDGRTLIFHPGNIPVDLVVLPDQVIKSL